MSLDYEDIAHDITYNPKKRIDLFLKIRPHERYEVFFRLSNLVQKSIVNQLPDSDLVDLLDCMDIVNAQSTVLAINSDDRKSSVIAQLNSELKQKCEYFLQFHPRATLGLLNFYYIITEGDRTVDDVSEIIDSYYKKRGRFPEILIEHNGIIIGEVPINSLIRYKRNSKLSDIVIPITTLYYNARPEKIIHTINLNKHKKVVILDKDKSVVGIIYSDDIISLFNTEPASSLYDFAGVSAEEKTFDSINSKVNHRYKWLLINLVTGFLAASIVGLFETTIEKFVVLAVYMPIVAGMGGNAATQTLAVMVRGIAVGEVTLKNGMPAIKREVGAGLVNGVINGLVVAIIAIFWNQDPVLGLVLGVAMVSNLVIAGFFGALIPLLMKHFGKDPATSATIFIATATDVFGFIVFLGLATLLMV